ncbi:hypothetical protein NT2_12_00260 [Caenibius tardaugens NBRC 16725]|uniref:SnoaL-like domain-containing protein n=1 Tax=Caenibius tardaugens NBRC 16725 TaxID=1219035 RepID=U2YQ18_9SPHN|nr:nuclear transport factor 2 family protein [Caenibius tardaugens]GAD50762.1 hypothetical protein NT2_12_00260 [Caenibius tardaugens NBRC 16725]
MTANLEALEQAYRRNGSLYARAMDANEPDLLDGVMTADAVIESPGAVMDGIAAIRACPGMLREMFQSTQHLVHNQTVEQLSDTEARGETYCTASHILPPSGEGQPYSALVWAIRYQDQLRLVDGVWKIAKRALVLDWTETRPVDFSGRQGA